MMTIMMMMRRQLEADDVGANASTNYSISRERERKKHEQLKDEEEDAWQQQDPGRIGEAKSDCIPELLSKKCLFLLYFTTDSNRHWKVKKNRQCPLQESELQQRQEKKKIKRG